MKNIEFSHTGKRKTNQDIVLTAELSPDNWLYVIADGMGGYFYGELAAKMVVENILAYLSSVKKLDQKEIQKAINKANLAIRQEREQSLEEMGATVGGFVLSKNKALCFWVGDVQIFGFRKNALFFESESHTLVNQLKKNNTIAESSKISKYKHIVTRSVQGKIEKSQIGFFELSDLAKDDILMICSDGVHDILDGFQIQRILNSSNSLEKATKEVENLLIIEATDNFSLIGIKL